MYLNNIGLVLSGVIADTNTVNNITLSLNVPLPILSVGVYVMTIKVFFQDSNSMIGKRSVTLNDRMSDDRFRPNFSNGAWTTVCLTDIIDLQSGYFQPLIKVQQSSGGAMLVSGNWRIVRIK